jgi:hypothetical protein
MTRKIIDLSIFLENDVISDPPGAGPEITYINHQQSVDGMASFFPGLKKRTYLTEKPGLSNVSV